MQVEKLIASLLQKHGIVFIPTLGELAVNKVNTKLEGSQIIPGNTSLLLNPFSDNNDGLLLHAFSKEMGTSVEDAQNNFSKAIQELKSNLDSGKSIKIPGYGSLIKKDVTIEFQEEKNHFLPNDFFGLSSLNVQNPNTSFNLDQFVSITVESKIIINNKNIEQSTESIDEPLREIPTISNIEVAQESELIQSILEEEVELVIKETQYNEVNTSAPQPEKTFESKYTTSPRHQQTTKKSNLKWSTVAGLVSLFLIASFLTAWVYATLKCNKMMGLNPLWDHGCQKVPLAETSSVELTKNDTSTEVKPVSAENAPVLAANTPVATSSPAVAPAKNEKEPPNVVEKPTAVAPPKPIVKIEKPITVKPKDTKPIEKSVAKPVEKSIAKVEKQVAEKPKIKEFVKVNANEKPKETTKVEEKPKVVKESKVVIKPMPKVPMSAAYRKGMSYLCFGTFKNPTVAKKLRMDMKSIGVVTETIEIDGTYRVVIPYTNRKFAETAAEDYPNTIIFE